MMDINDLLNGVIINSLNQVYFNYAILNTKAPNTWTMDSRKRLYEHGIIVASVRVASYNDPMYIILPIDLIYRSRRLIQAINPEMYVFDYILLF